MVIREISDCSFLCTMRGAFSLDTITRVAFLGDAVRIETYDGQVFEFHGGEAAELREIFHPEGNVDVEANSNS